MLSNVEQHPVHIVVSVKKKFFFWKKPAKLSSRIRRYQAQSVLRKYFPGCRETHSVPVWLRKICDLGPSIPTTSSMTATISDIPANINKNGMTNRSYLVHRTKLVLPISRTEVSKGLVWPQCSEHCLTYRRRTIWKRQNSHSFRTTLLLA